MEPNIQTTTEKHPFIKVTGIVLVILLGVDILLASMHSFIAFIAIFTGPFVSLIGIIFSGIVLRMKIQGQKRLALTVLVLSIILGIMVVGLFSALHNTRWN